MKIKHHDKIEVLLNSLVKLGDVHLDDILIDYFMTLPPEDIPRKIRERSIKKLEKAQRELLETRKRLQKPMKLNSLGEFLKLLKKSRQYDTAEFAKRIGVDEHRLSLFENDEISPLEISLNQMLNLIQTVRLKPEFAIELIKKSYQLFKLRPQFTKASARYDDKLGSPEDKQVAMDRALKELLLKSKSRKLQYPTDLKINRYLDELKKKLK